MLTPEVTTDASHRATSRSGHPTRHARGLTLVELLVIVATILLLLAALFPAASHARALTRGSTCTRTLNSIGVGFTAYTAENEDHIPGVNTSGLAIRAKLLAPPEYLDHPDVPVQSFDWMTPLAKYGMVPPPGDIGTTRMREWGVSLEPGKLPPNRVARWHYLWTNLRCPVEVPFVDAFYPPGGLDPDFYDYTWRATSYLMPAYFSYWGSRYQGAELARMEYTSRPLTVRAQTVPTSFDVASYGFCSKFDQVGPPDRKIFVADGTRYLAEDGSLDIDVSPAPNHFGAFSSSGGWQAQSTAYGVAANTDNWDGDHISGSGSPSQGRNLLLSYRHGWTSAPAGPLGVEDNEGCINALMFDGHVSQLDDYQSRDIAWWYPPAPSSTIPATV